MPSAACASCGTVMQAAARFCPACGTAVAPPAPGPESSQTDAAADVLATASRQAQATYTAPATPLNELRLNVQIAGLPLELWLVIGLFTAPGIYLVQLTLRALPDAFRFFNDTGGPFRKLALVLIILLFMVLALGAGLVAIAWLLHQADRVGRGLAYVTVACLASLVIFGDGTTTGEVLSMFAGLLAAAILAFAPAVKDFFTGSTAPQRSQPTSIVVARVSMAIWIGLLTVASILDFLLGDIAGKYVALGVLELMIAAAVLALYLRLPIGDRTTRGIVTIGAIIAFILLLIGRHDNGFVILVGLTAAIPICLWIPRDAREFYGDPPLVISTAPRG
jgi:hypothetical protein